MLTGIIHKLMLFIYMNSVKAEIGNIILASFDISPMTVFQRVVIQVIGEETRSLRL